MTAICNYTNYTWSDLNEEDVDEWMSQRGLPFANYLGLGNVHVVIWDLQD